MRTCSPIASPIRQLTEPNLEHPKGKHPRGKHQIPNTKLQNKLKHQIPMTSVGSNRGAHFPVRTNLRVPDTVEKPWSELASWRRIFLPLLGWSLPTIRTAGHRGRLVQMGRPLPGCPEGTNENSPAFQRWVSEPEGNESRQGRQKVVRSRHVFLRPYRAPTRLLAVVPAMNRWAIIGRPFGARGRAGGFPALKRRAILKMSLRDKERGERFFRQASKPIHCRCVRGHFAVTVSSQEDGGHTQLLVERAGVRADVSVHLTSMNPSIQGAESGVLGLRMTPGRRPAIRAGPAELSLEL